MSAHLGNGDVLIASRFGSMGELERVWWVPTAPLTLIPAQAFHQLGYVITFTPTEIILRHTPDMQITVFAERIHGVMTVVVDNFHGMCSKSETISMMIKMKRAQCLTWLP